MSEDVSQHDSACTVELRNRQAALIVRSEYYVYMYQVCLHLHQPGLQVATLGSTRKASRNNACETSMRGISDKCELPYELRAVLRANVPRTRQLKRSDGCPGKSRCSSLIGISFKMQLLWESVAFFFRTFKTIQSLSIKQLYLRVTCDACKSHKRNPCPRPSQLETPRSTWRMHSAAFAVTSCFHHWIPSISAQP